VSGAPYRFEHVAWRRGLTRVAGVDEAGRGPLAGPVVAAAVILAPGIRIDGVDDSKRLIPDERARLFDVIQSRAVAVGVGMADHETIDRINILEATRLAMRMALAALPAVPELVLTDYVALAGLECPQKNLIEGDRRSASVAAASIVAKVTRDRLMEAADLEYPEYGFGRHKGYPTPEHRDALQKHGPCRLHRRSFAGVLPFEPRGGRRAAGEERHEASAGMIQSELFEWSVWSAEA
jgi:ribonuclease HII